VDLVGAWQVLEFQQGFILDLFESTVAFFETQSEETWTRGRRNLLEAVRSFAGAGLPEGSHHVVGVAPPLNVNPDRLSIPAQAGVCDPEQYLKGRQLWEYQNLDRLVLPECEWEDPLPRACHMMDLKAEHQLRRRLVENGMGRLIEEPEVPTDVRGRKLLAGSFVVEHKTASDRLIIDRRPQNGTEARLNWCDLPHCTLCYRLVLPPWETVRGSLNDISCFFYCLRNPGG
jgi:hypothetical protein